VDDLVRALGLEGVSRSEVSRICQELDEAMERFRNRPLEGEYPYLWLDAKPVRVRYDSRVVQLSGSGGDGGAPGRAAGGVGLGRGGQREL
jgi:transposase-like protein